MSARKSTMTILLIGISGFALWVGPAWWRQRQWFALQTKQLVTIKRLEEFPPHGWDPDTWRNALITPYNVWGNVTYSPTYSNISNIEMQALQLKLDRIIAEATVENSMECVDKVFALLLQRGRKTRFITGYRDEFRSFDDNLQHRFHRDVRPHEPESSAEPVANEESSPPAR